MALTDQVELRAGFLQEAAHLLSVSSPAAAAFLGGARDRLVEDADLEIAPKEYDAYRRSICGACGNVMVSGWSCKVSNRPQLEGDGKKRKASVQRSTKLQKHNVYECLRCHRETIQALQLKPRRQVKKSKSHVESRPEPDVSSSRKEVHDIVAKTANASSKQRQRARKGGLQAMLEKNKTQTSSQGGLDLMDFAM